jgi:hypothetical protein
VNKYKYKFSELSDKAKKQAAHYYRQGLFETRDADDVPTIQECLEYCQDCENDLLYNKNGKIKGD